MRIGFDAKRAFNNHSGLGNYSRNLISGLNNYYPGNQYFLYTPKQVNGLFAVPWNCSLIKTPSKAIHKTFSSYWRTYAISKDINRDQLDIYHGLSHELPVGIEKQNCKSVVTIHDLIFLRHPELYKGIDRWIYKKKFQNACEKADKIVAVSKQTADDIRSLFKINPTKIDVVYQGCNPVFQEIANEETRKSVREKYKLPEQYLLYIGTIERRKNLLSLVKALHQSNLSVPLIAIGRKTDYFREITDYIHKNRLNSVYFLNIINNDELPAIYQMAKVFVYPSLFEGFGIPVLESLFSKTPVITSRGGCFPEAGGPGSLYVDPLNVEEIADALQRVTNDENLRNRMIEAGIKYAGKFTPEKTTEEMMKVYKNMPDQ